MKKYSSDARACCMVAYMRLRSLRKAAHTTGISKSTIQRWAQGSPLVTTRRAAKKATTESIQTIIKVLEDNPFLSPKAVTHLIAQKIKLQLSSSCVRFWMKKMKITRKKARRFNNKDSLPLQRSQFAKDFTSVIDPERVVSIDESSFYFDMKPSYGYCASWKRLKIPALPGGRTRWSLLMAVTNDRVVGWKLKKGSFKSPDFVDFISNLDTDKRDVLLLDNASIHKTGPVMDAIVFRGLTPCFLPPYTPEFQPIEHCFSVLKARYRMLPPAADLPCGNDVAVRVRHSMLHLRPESLTNMFRACWERAGAFASFEIIRAPGSGRRV